MALFLKSTQSEYDWIFQCLGNYREGPSTKYFSLSRQLTQRTPVLQPERAFVSLIVL